MIKIRKEKTMIKVVKPLRGRKSKKFNSKKRKKKMQCQGKEKRP